MLLYLFWKMDPKKSKNSSPRIKVIQKLYNSLMNPEAEINYPKSQYKKFIKDVVTGTIERSELIASSISLDLSKVPVTTSFINFLYWLLG